MKKYTLLLAMIFGINSYGQIVPSSCTAPDSIVTKYKDDADQLAVRRIFKTNSTYIDSATIPQTVTDTFLNALLAVYNATSLPARDTVVTMFDVHTFGYPTLNYFSVAADSTLSWMQQLRLGNLVTGNSQVDSLISTYHLYINAYSNLTIYPWDIVWFKSDSNYNISVITNYFKTISGVQYAEPSGEIGDGNEITDSVDANFIELIYSYGWGDCPSGCIYRRYWKFRVYYDCSVEFVSSYGSPLPITGINDIEKKSFSISPNPFNKIIRIDGISQPFNYSVSNLLGQELTKGQSIKNYLTDFNGMTSGLYILTIQTDTQFATFKILKE